MNSKNAFKVLALFLCDIAFLYLALFATLIIRYGADFYAQLTKAHLLPFTVIFIPWIAVFYIAGLYDLRRLRNNLDFLKTLGLATLVSAIVAVFLFYLIPFFEIAPKTNLFVFILVFAFMEVMWRRSFNLLIASGEPPNKMLLVSNGNSGFIGDVIAKNPEWIKQLGYELSIRMSEQEAVQSPQKIRELADAKKINFIAMPRRLKHNEKLTRTLYELIGTGVEVRDLSSFYENITRKIPLAELEESWFLENIIARENFYDPLKRFGEFSVAAFLAAILLPIELIIAMGVKLSSSGPVIYRQIRIGERGKKFVLYKFRTMKLHENHSWPGENDERITKIGKLLRKTHLDELPQLWNIVKGDISVVGPRPDFVDFYEKLEREIPYYSIRTIVKPGLTGWAQIHKPIIASLEDTKERLEYDLYYIKNRSLVLDLAIILKTFKVLVTAKGL